MKFEMGSCFLGAIQEHLHLKVKNLLSGFFPSKNLNKTKLK